MPQRVYFDTVTFRAVGTAFEKDVLPTDLKERMLISPLTAFEVLAQLTIKDAEGILRQIQALYNWTAPTRTGLLPWPDDALYQWWYGTTAPDDARIFIVSPDELSDAHKVEDVLRRITKSESQTASKKPS